MGGPHCRPGDPLAGAPGGRRKGMPPVKYHYSYRFFTYPVRRGGEPRGALASGSKPSRRDPPGGATRSGDSGRWGV